MMQRLGCFLKFDGSHAKEVFKYIYNPNVFVPHSTIKRRSAISREESTKGVSMCYWAVCMAK